MPNNQCPIPPVLQDGLIGSFLGGTMAVGRMLCSREARSWGYIARRTFLASLTAGLCAVATKPFFETPGMWGAAMGAIGYASPEILEALVDWVRRRGKSL